MPVPFGPYAGRMGTTLNDGLEVRPSWGKRLVGIEGLRGLAALSVLVHHVSLRTAEPGSALIRGSEFLTHGLTLFFVLSGFLLFRPFAASIIEGRTAPSVRRYAWNRFLRIYPAYVVILLVACVILDAAYRYGSPQTSPVDNLGRLTDPGTLIANLFLVQTYIPGTISTGIGPAWSLSAEVAFYVLLPLLAAASMLMARKIRPTLAVWVAPLVLFGVGMMTTVALAIYRRGMTPDESTDSAWGQNWSSVISRSVLAQADLFAYGMVAAVVVCLLRQKQLSVTKGWVKMSLMLGAGLVAFVAVAGPLDALATKGVGVASAMLLLAVVLPSSQEDRQGNRLAAVLEWAPLRYLGLISYSFYLWHNPILWWLKDRGMLFGSSTLEVLLNVLLVLGVTIILSTVTYLLVERPAMRMKARAKHEQKASVAA